VSGPVCPKCGTRQDPEHPVCVHLMGAKGGRKAQRTLLERYGTEKHAEAGRKGGLARWGIKRDEG